MSYEEFIGEESIDGRKYKTSSLYEMYYDSNIGLYITKQVPCSKRILEEIKEPEKIETSKTLENTVEITPNM